MFACPDCHVGFTRLTARLGVLWECPNCRTRVADLSALRHTRAGAFERQLYMLALRTTPNSRRACPGCAKQMAEVPTIALAGAPAPLRLDICPRCELVWFDPREHEAWLAAPAAAGVDLPIETRRALDASGVTNRLARTAALRAAAEARYSEELKYGFIEKTPKGETHGKQLLCLVFGLPVEVEPPPLRFRPWATWSLAAVIALVSLSAFGVGESVIKTWGMVSADLWRHHGLTLMTSFFLHGSLLHLAGNLYFLLVFGDDVEDHLGRAAYLVLIALSAVTGDLVQATTHARSTVPNIGASGGISGVMAFYALRFARRRIRLVLGFPSPSVKWLRYGWLFDMHAWAAMALWVLVQLVGVAWEVAGGAHDGIAHMAHLGGAAMGAAFWLGDRWYR